MKMTIAKRSQRNDSLQSSSSDLLTSQLYNDETFYRAFMRDLNGCTSEAVIVDGF
ncbi:MAG: hypothetical protein JWL85_25 [Candidatus Saccharibacteria bacterium]|nr:hypothetical protein [Candidatus Saccharibacteria bacterium]